MYKINVVDEILKLNQLNLNWFICLYFVNLTDTLILLITFNCWFSLKLT